MMVTNCFTRSSIYEQPEVVFLEWITASQGVFPSLTLPGENRSWMAEQQSTVLSLHQDATVQYSAL